MEDTILGVSLGTRWVGIAVGTRSDLIFSQLKYYPQTFSKKKLKKIWRTIEQTMDAYGVTYIAVKIPPGYTRSEGLNYCMEYITQCTLKKKIPLKFYDIETIQRHFIKSKGNNRLLLAQKISEKYPELKKEYFKLKKGQQYIKTFEAVAAIELAILEIS